ncbi:hypothetical protein PHPALM_3086 [Phytophthora palmivora]|uniref:RNase H type-1 domain-containing protein n=1 Tax=Phytophthora palmivora TaxID=4796 RepID=A0A2P4YN93_9STRA|nr:hypothetical protein PHPALM_3086 [Phytophthora palmivora]
MPDLVSTAGFRPSPAELRVHQTARVGPRPNGELIESNLFSFWRLSALDRVSFILNEERRRGLYRVTKVTAKMIFAVDFGTRPIDHFLPSSAQSSGGRTVVPDSSTWASGDTLPSGSISSIHDLRSTLQCIHQVATEWYPEEVANVFSAVYYNSTSHVVNAVPPPMVYAMVNLYTHVFSRLCISISQNAHAASLVDHARSIMATNSPDYFRLVSQVVDRGLLSTWAQTADSTPRPPYRTHGRSSHRRARMDPQRTPRHRSKQASPVPDSVLRQVPHHDDKLVCLKFQTQHGCDFRSCKYAHATVQLPAEAATYITGKHGPLANGHPNLTTSPQSSCGQPTLDVDHSHSDVSDTKHSARFGHCPPSLPIRSAVLTLSFDGGARSIPTISAHACCIWGRSDEPLWWTATAVSPGGTNNEMEAQGLLSGLRWLHQHHHGRPVRFVGDSAIVVGMAATSMRVRAPNLIPLIGDIRRLINQPRHHLQAVSRVFNVTADALCNWVMDTDLPVPRHKTASGIRFPLPEPQWQDPYARGCPPSVWIDPDSYDRTQWLARWSLVVLDFKRVCHLVQNRFLRRHMSEFADLRPLDTMLLTLDTPARAEASPFDTDICRECTANGIARCFPLGVFRSFQSLATRYHLPFPINRIFRKPNADF